MATKEVAELKTNTTTLQEYYSKLSASLEDPTANQTPSFEDYSPLLKNEDLLTAARTNADTGSAISMGAVTDSAHAVTALSREFGMRSRPKVSYILGGQTESATLVDQHQDNYGRYQGWINRGSTVVERA